MQEHPRMVRKRPSESEVASTKIQALAISFHLSCNDRTIEDDIVDDQANAIAKLGLFVRMTRPSPSLQAVNLIHDGKYQQLAVITKGATQCVVSFESVMPEFRCETRFAVECGGFNRTYRLRGRYIGDCPVARLSPLPTIDLCNVSSDTANRYVRDLVTIHPDMAHGFPDKFFLREETLYRWSQIDAMSKQQGNLCRTFVLTGPEGTGKTNELNFFHAYAKTQNYCVVFADTAADNRDALLFDALTKSIPQCLRGTMAQAHPAMSFDDLINTGDTQALVTALLEQCTVDALILIDNIHRVEDEEGLWNAFTTPKYTRTVRTVIVVACSNESGIVSRAHAPLVWYMQPYSTREFAMLLRFPGWPKDMTIEQAHRLGYAAGYCAGAISKFVSDSLMVQHWTRVAFETMMEDTQRRKCAAYLDALRFTNFAPPRELFLSNGKSPLQLPLAYEKSILMRYRVQVGEVESFVDRTVAPAMLKTIMDWYLQGRLNHDDPGLAGIITNLSASPEHIGSAFDELMCIGLLKDSVLGVAARGVQRSFDFSNFDLIPIEKAQIVPLANHRRQNFVVRGCAWYPRFDYIIGIWNEARLRCTLLFVSATVATFAVHERTTARIRNAFKHQYVVTSTDDIVQDDSLADQRRSQIELLCDWANPEAAPHSTAVRTSAHIVDNDTAIQDIDEETDQRKRDDKLRFYIEDCDGNDVRQDVYIVHCTPRSQAEDDLVVDYNGIQYADGEIWYCFDHQLPASVKAVLQQVNGHDWTAFSDDDAGFIGGKT
eukprot:TRINITY_DN5438_c0_g1_i1.p1 TRINITY_DN5438_c0_g1~~TRINITY_DN5438_c0_g1_i1.p1  ORF type:complete len:772 (-),score=139.71 TRINITY_DN5438_c0_g1_i1:101-2416(-)